MSIADLRQENDRLEALADKSRADPTLPKETLKFLIDAIDKKQERNAAIISEVLRAKPTMYAFMDTDSGEITLSAYVLDDPKHENNNIVLKDARGSKHESVLNILSNVLHQCGVRLEVEK